MKVLIACEESPEAQQGKSLLLTEAAMPEIRVLRASTGLSQAKFADLLGIPLRTLSDWERGIASPPPYVVRLIAFFLAHREEK